MTHTESLQCAIPNAWVTGFSQCLYEWQGLEGAALALVAAYLSIQAIRRQIRQDKDHHSDELSRRHNAARLTLPLALAGLSELIASASDEIAGRLERLREFERNKEKGGDQAILAVTKLPILKMDTEILKSFKDFVETLNQPIDIRHVAELISSMQIFIARNNEYDFRQIASETSLNTLMIDVAKIKLLIDKIYNYARFVDNESFGIVDELNIDEVWDEILGKAQNIVFMREQPDEFFPALGEEIGRYKEAGITPWNEKF